MLTVTFGKTFSGVLVPLVIEWELGLEHGEGGVKGPGSAQPAQAGRQRGGQAREQGGGQARGETAAGLILGKGY